MVEVLVGDLGDGDIDDLDLGLADEVEQQVEGALEGVEMDSVFDGHGSPGPIVPRAGLPGD